MLISGGGNLLKDKQDNPFQNFTKIFTRKNDASICGISDLKNNSKLFGFTLAEVLITLGIIGVVAAMTIPTLISNTRGLEYRNKFKKNLSVLNQAIKLNIANYGYDFSSINAQCVGNGTTDNPENVQSICAIFNGSISGIQVKDFTNLKLKDGKTLYYVELYKKATSDTVIKERGVNLYYFQMKDGAFFAIHAPWSANATCSLKNRTLEEALKDSNFENYCTGWIDVNGISGPNKETRCTDLKSHSLDINSECIVKNSPNFMGDVFPVVVYDGTVAPGSAAARAVLNSSK